MEVNDIDWVDEETVGSVKAKHGPLLEAMKASGSSEWARVATFTNEASARDLAHRLKNSHAGFEVVSRKVKDGVGGAVYARYVGEDE